METLFEKVIKDREQQAGKHGLGDDFAELQLNSLSNFEFLQELSEALEDLLRERRVAGQ